MIRIVRTYLAQAGKRQQVVDVLKEISAYAATQDINIQVLTEPWGDMRRVYINTDYVEADTGLEWLEGEFLNPKAREAGQSISELTDGEGDVTCTTIKLLGKQPGR